MFGLLDVDRLLDALGTVQGWSQPSDIAATKAHHGYRQVCLVTAGQWRPEGEPFRFALEPLAPIRNAWLSWIEPGGFILLHRDGGPYLERWQIPIRTAGRFFQDGVELTQVDGFPFQVHHWLPHQVRNDTEAPRVHIVIDRDIPVDVPSQPFEVIADGR